MVICTDVLEHIPEEDLDWVIREICSLSNSKQYL
jgi:2-polyprenyl-3-methyl-5-hydroxy-6-metoxy-1,4-benzoquinol methylase